MITWKEKGMSLLDALGDAGISIHHRNSIAHCSPSEKENDAQLIIDSHDPVPYERTQAYARIIEQANSAAAALESAYPEIEKRTFLKQESEARAYIADSSAEPLTLGIIAAARGIGVSTIAQAVVTKADQFTVLAANIIGARQHAEDLIDAETDWKKIQLINLVVA
tara:strand:- start:197 stop:694 length:498 start_codon:yes stop_codon:yes gene_type:complete